MDPTAHVGPWCAIGEDVRIGPYAPCSRAATTWASTPSLAAHSHLFPNAVLYGQTQIGQRVRIHAGAIIGSDGFGYVLDGEASIGKCPRSGTSSSRTMSKLAPT